MGSSRSTDRTSKPSKTAARATRNRHTGRNALDARERHWSEFELLTRDALEALGYRVKHNVHIAGSQVDLYAERQLALSTHRVLVECKDRSSNASAADVRQCSSRVNSVATIARPVSGLIVSASGFTSPARNVAERLGITLLTLEELQRRSFDPSPLLVRQQELFEGDALSSLYVNVSCKASDTGNTVYKPVEPFLDTHLASTKRPGIALLGNFGSGKTSLCKHYAYLLAKRWLTSERSFMPLYVDLRQMRSLVNLEQHLLDYMRDAYDVDVDAAAWRMWTLQNKTLLILDGLDEMASRMDKVEINDHLASLTRACRGNMFKAMLACRTHFFRSQVDESVLGNMMRLYVCDWGKQELADYVTRSQPDSAQQSLDFITSTYNLEELARTPLFLNMITATLEQLDGAPNKAKLYQVYTDQWIQHQDYRSVLASEEKQRFMEELAIALFGANEAALPHQALPGTIRRMLSRYDSVLEAEVRTCTFLVREGDSYRFVHKSYMEFFAGTYLAKCIKTGQFDPLAGRVVSVEVGSFVADYFDSDTDILIRALLGASNEVVRQNACIVLSFCRGGTRDLIADSLAIASRADSSEVVRQSAIEALSQQGTDAALRHLTEHVKGRTTTALAALLALGRHCERPIAAQCHRDVLAGTEDGAIGISLGNIAEARAETLADAVVQFALTSLSAAGKQARRGFLRAAHALLDKNLVGVLGQMVATSTEEDRDLGHVRDAYCTRFKGQVLQEARQGKAAGLKKAAVVRKLRQDHGWIVDAPVVEAELSAMFETAKPRKGRR